MTVAVNIGPLCQLRNCFAHVHFQIATKLMMHLILRAPGGQKQWPQLQCQKHKT